MNWKSLLTPFTDGEINEIETGLGRMTILNVEKRGDFILIHGKNVDTGNPISVSKRRRRREIPVAAE